MTARSTQAHRLAGALSDATGVRVTATYADSEGWRFDWADGPLPSEMREQAAAMVADRDYPALREVSLKYGRGESARAWAAWTIAARANQFPLLERGGKDDVKQRLRGRPDGVLLFRRSGTGASCGS